MNPLLVYLLLINAAATLLMLLDKYKARKNLWRIPERTLLLVAAFGGSLGAMLGMYLFRHKTRHLKFSAGLPAMFLVQAVILLWILK